ncbi:lytic murein transglycosylase [Dactylosporangium sp. CA-139066]|uniref:lytic transglycosylase domain-containing protein n=1 Tax=Dactylosporangium sp. CA-139066 TaxID=3239930 RepID=UPI003D9202C5
MASNDEAPEVDRPTTVDTPPAAVIRPPAPEPTAVPSPAEPAAVPSPAEPAAVPSPAEPAAVPSPAEPAAVPSPAESSALPAPREASEERRMPVDIIPPTSGASPGPAEKTGEKPPHRPKHAAPEPPAGDVLESRRRRFDEWRERFAAARTRPGFRFLVPSLLIALMLALAGAAGFAGGKLPSARQADPTGTAAPPTGTNGPPATGAPATGEAPQPADPSATAPYSPPPGTKTRPADVYGAWAATRAVRLDIPVVALQAYGYAEAITARTTPRCHLTWTTLAGIGKIESDHGRTNNSVLQDDGRSVPPIVGPPLDGQNGRQAVPDTDQGTLDTDKTWDRAVGPMQFLPSTWRQYGVDADNDGVIDINDIDDAALTAAAYLCANDRDLSTLEGWNQAIHSYNVPEEYRAAVFNATNDYGRRDRQG